MVERVDTQRRGAGRKAAAGAVHSPVGEQIRRERDRLGLSLRELARRLDVSPSLVSQIETGKIQPSVRTLYAIVTELGVSLDDLFELPPKGADDPDAATRPAARSWKGKAKRASASAPAQTRAEPRPFGGLSALSDDAPGGGDGASAPAATPGVPLVQRADGRRTITLSGGVQWQRLTPWHDPDVDFLMTRYEPGATSSPDGRLLRHNGREYGVVLSGRLKVTVGFEEYLLEAGDSISFDSSIPHRLETDGDDVAETVWVVIGRSGDPRE